MPCRRCPSGNDLPGETWLIRREVTVETVHDSYKSIPAAMSSPAFSAADAKE
jgi:hypothetical protein